MERHVKERLVGAAVLMAAAIILIPEMLSGPDRTGGLESARSTAEEPFKTYTIDLNGSSGSTASPSVTEEPAPPPERMARMPAVSEAAVEEKPEPSDEAEPEAIVASTTAPASPSAESSRADTPPLRSSQPVPARSATSPPESARGEPDDLPEVPTTRGWAVQLGSFSNRSTAEQLSAQFRGQGYQTFVMPVKTGATTLYRVRVGPMRERASAEEALRKISGSAKGAAVVVHP